MTETPSAERLHSSPPAMRPGAASFVAMEEGSMDRISPRNRAIILTTLAVVYGVVAKLSFLVTIPPGNISPIFPASGIALAAVLLWGRSVLPALWVGSFVSNIISFTGGNLAEAASPKSIFAATLIGVGAAVGGWIGATWVRRFCRGGNPLAGGVQILCLFFFGAFAGCLFSPIVGVGSLMLAGFIAPSGAGFAWLTWWIGDIIGCIVMAPLVLAWSLPQARILGGRGLRWSVAEATLLGVVTAGVSFLAFFSRLPVEYVLLMVLVWAASRFGMRGVSVVSLAIACAAVVGTSLGMSIFSANGRIPALLLLDSYLGTAIICAYILAGVLEERRRGAGDLLATESRLELAADAAAIGVWDWDIRNDHLVWDESMFRLYGVRREDFASVYEAWLGCVHPDDAKAVDKAICAALRGEKEYATEFRIRRPDGPIRHIHAIGRTFRDAQGHATRMVGTNIDVTERKLMEEKLLGSEALFRSLFDAIPIPLSYSDKVGNVRRNNTQFVKTFGYTAEEMPTVEDWLRQAYPDPDYRDQVITKWHDAVAAASVGNCSVPPAEYQVTCKDGTARTVEISGIFVGNHFVATFLDITDRKHAEIQLRESEARYRRIIATANEGIWLLDQEKTLFVNARMACMLGYAVEEFVGKAPTEFMFPEDRAHYFSMREARKAGLSQTYERRFRHKDGHVVWTHVSASPVHDDSGSIVGSFAMFADITERKKAESRDRHIRYILELVASGKPLPQILEFVCRAVEKDLPGAIASVLLFEPETGRLHHGAAPDLPEFYKNAIDGIAIGHGIGSCGSAAADGIPVIVEDIQTHPYWENFQEIAAKAGLRACWSLPILTSDGKVVATFAIYHAQPFAPEPEDIQAVQVFVESIRIAVESHRSAEEIRRHREHLEELVRERSRKLVENERLLSTILDNVDACIYLKDAQGRYIFANRPVLDLWRTTLEEIAGIGDEKFFDRETVERIRRNDRQVLVEGSVIRSDETTTVPATGKTMTYQSTKLPLRRENGEIYALCGISTDITARKELELDLIRAKDAAETASRAKSAFLSNMSHELRTPLNAILGYAQVMLRDRAPDAPDAETLRIINKSGEHLLSLINSVLDLSKIESHKYSLELEDFDLGEFMRDITDTLRRRAQDKGISLAVDQTSSFPRYIHADRNKLRQVLLNIVGNAIKFTDNGGVTVHLATNGLSTIKGAGELVFTVSDTGPGIHEDDYERIFRPFEQAANRPRIEGTGLGLALAREFTRLMGGDVRVRSDIGHGSVFTFNVAYAPVDETSVAKLSTQVEGKIVGIAGAEDVRVLIVEDQLENRTLLRELLSRFGFTLAEAENGEIATRIAAEWKPDVILMDRRMPVMDGVEATRLIREMPGGKNVRIAAVTAEAFLEDYRGMTAAGCDAFIRKPYRIEEILEFLGTHPSVHLVRAALEPSPVEFDPREHAMVEFAKLPVDVVANLREACEAADAEEAAKLLEPHPEAGEAAAPFLKSFRLDILASLLPVGAAPASSG